MHKKILLFFSLFFIYQISFANIVTNSFFTGTTTLATGWVSSAAGTGAAFNHALSTANSAITTDGGSTEFYSGCVGAVCLTYPFVSGSSSGAQQTLVTTIGQSYTLSFWTYYSTANKSTVEIDVYWGATKVFPLSTTPSTVSGWVQTTINLGMATTTSQVLTVLVRDDPAYSAITDVAVNLTPVALAPPTLTKNVFPICDLVNGNLNPKMFTGANVQYAITAYNGNSSPINLTNIIDSLPSFLTLDPKLNNGNLPKTNCTSGNVTNSLSSTGFAMHTGTGSGPGFTSPGISSDAVSAGVTVSGQTITINFSTLATSSVAAPAAAVLNAGSYITIYFNAYIN